jgi:adenosylcobinamide-GDP ribazoletransferase
MLALACAGIRLVPPLLLAVLISATLAVLTRALHLDGLADLADGIGGGYTPQRRLEIMKDSHTGAFGAVAIVLALGFKIAAMNTLLEHRFWAPFLLAPMFSRFSMVLAAHRSHYARAAGGLAKPFLEHMTGREVLHACLTTAIVSILFSPSLTLFFFPLVLGSVWSVRRLTQRTLGGITGDVLGAINEINEVLLFFAAASFVHS